MAPKSKIPPESWKSRKEVIIDLYLNQGKKLADVIEILAKDYSFHASKSQYITQLSKWKVEKYSSREVWTLAEGLVRKRKLEGKQTEIYIDGKKVPEKKLKKALSRPSISQDEPRAHSFDPTVGSSGVTAHTPKPDHTRGIEIGSLPWFHFQSLLETSFINLAVPPLSGWSVEGTLDLAYTGIADARGWSELNFISDFTGSAGFILDNDTTQRYLESPRLSEAPTTSTTNEQTGCEAQFVLGQYRSECTDLDDLSPRDLFLAMRQKITIEQQEEQKGPLIKRVEHLFGKSTFNAAYQPLRYAAYFSSNNRLSSTQTLSLVRWIAQNDIVWTIERLLDNQLPTIEIFCGNLLVAAAGEGEIAIVKALLSKGVDPNYLGGGSHSKETALHHASWREDIGLVELLLKNGANPDIHSIGCNRTAFEVALRFSYTKTRRPEIPLMMVRARSKVVRSLATIEDRPYLAMAAEFHSLELVQAMLSAGALANDDTGFAASALQIATESDNLEMVEALLVAGADVNYPAGEKYRRGREHLVTNYPQPAYYSQSPGRYLPTSLHLAIRRNNMKMVQTLMEAGADISSCPALEYLPWLYPNSDNENCEDDCEDEHVAHKKVLASEGLINRIERSYMAETLDNVTDTPLEAAVRRNNVAAVHLLLRLGADINARGGFATALQAAATVEQGCHMIRLLLSKGANVNSPARGPGAMTALQAAASSGNEEAVGVLLKAKANVNAPPSPVKGRTALQAAVETGNISLVRFLISAGATVNASAAPEGGKTCLQAAVEVGNAELISLLWQSGGYTNTGPEYYAAKFYALKAALDFNRQDVIRRLSRPFITQPSEDPSTVLMITTAIRQCKSMLAQQLLAKAGPTVRMPYKQSFLMTAVQAGLLDLVYLFIEAGANVNVPIEGELPVETAVKHSHPACLKTLLEAGADVKGIIGAKAVADAVRRLDTEGPSMLYILLSAGASPKKVPGCESPLQLATERMRIKKKVVRLLLLHGADPNEDSGIPLQSAAAEGCVPVVDLLLQAGADVNAPATFAYQKTALQGAAETSKIDLVEKLLDAGADINALPSPKWGKTALQAAVNSSSLAMVRLLLSRGADVNGPPSAAHGATALQQAVIRGNFIMTSLLLQHGADVNALAARLHGKTALEAAAEHERLDIMYLLLRKDKEPGTFNLRCRRAVKLAEKSGHLVLARVMEEWRVSHCEAGTGGR